jgi:predicted acyltransferase
MKNRNQSLDALRGFAILAMVLSSSIAFGILPAWMYHAQVPPPHHVYSPDLPGITWVDLVFPFFLFSMGAAIPLALGKKIKEGGGFLSILYTAARRWGLLVFFAFFTVYMRAGVLSAKPGTTDYLLSIAAFGLLFFQFYQPATEKFKWLSQVVRILAYAAGFALLAFLPFKNGKGFSTGRVDIIILVLGNMAFFGTLIWWFTRDRPWWRLAILPFIMAVFLGGGPNSPFTLNQWLYNWSPLPWMYRFYYLKYLFIIIPGTLAGDWLVQYAAGSRKKDDEAGAPGPVAEEMQEGARTAGMDCDGPLMAGITILSLLLILCNVIFLFGRHLLLNLAVTVVILGGLYYLLSRLGRPFRAGVADRTDNNRWLLLRRYYKAGACLLLLGLFFEAYEGGIKKDPSTYSYYFVCSGLAFFMLTGLYGLQLNRYSGAVVNFLSLNGRNPMVAYTAGNLLLIPLLELTGGNSLLDAMSNDPWLGVLRGVIFTGIVSLITVLFTRRKWFWKT